MEADVRVGVGVQKVDRPDVVVPLGVASGEAVGGGGRGDLGGGDGLGDDDLFGPQAEAALDRCVPNRCRVVNTISDVEGSMR